jgi:ribonucleoside-diphosphate reductase alpha chain
LIAIILIHGKTVLRELFRKYIPNGTKATKKGIKCPGCSQEDTLVYQDGCVICSDCGYSKCG